MRVSKIWDDLDKNKDGHLNLHEVLEKTFADDELENLMGVKSGDLNSVFSKLTEQVNTKKDNVITKEEFMKYFEIEMLIAAKLLRVAKIWDSLDGNKDGKVAMHEIIIKVCTDDEL